MINIPFYKKAALSANGLVSSSAAVVVVTTVLTPPAYEDIIVSRLKAADFKKWLEK